MNREKIWMHLTLVALVVFIAAVAGQVRRAGRENRRQHIYQSARGISERAVQTRTVNNDVDAIVRFRSGTTPARINEIAASFNDRIEDRIESFNDEMISVIDDEDLTGEQIAAAYSALPEVEYAEPNYQISLDQSETYTTERRNLSSAQADPKLNATDGAPNDPQFTDQWLLNNTGQRDGAKQADVRALEAWKLTHGTREVVVAVIDTGVDFTHQDLSGNIWTRPANVPAYTDRELGNFADEHGFNAVDNLTDPMDDNGHGTHCAGIIGAEGDNGIGIAGVNWQVEIMPLKFLSRTGAGSTKDAIEAINYVIDRKKAGVNVRIISASWGSTQKSQALGDAIKRAGEAGILFVAAAGNSSTNNDRRPHYPSNYDLPNVVSVAALDRHDKLAGFSNYGARTVHVAAPGREILSTWLDNDYLEASGTSMATPVVSGIAALMLSVEPDLTVQQLRERLLNATDKLPQLDGKTVSGGRINAARALNIK